MVIRHGMPMVLAQLIPLAASFLIVAVALSLGRNNFVTVTGTSATIAGLGALINVGVGTGAIRDLARARNDPQKTVLAVARNLRIASAISFVVLSISLIAAFGLWLVLPAGSPARVGVVFAFLLQIPSFLISPHTSVLSSTFQHLDREKENFGITLSRSVVALIIGLGVVLLVENDVLAISLQAAVGTAMACAMLIERWRRLGKSHRRVKLMHSPLFSRREIWDRVLNSLDGAVFMVLFIVAQLIAVSTSLEVGAQISTAVAFCRTVIIPLKMIGITAGRMALRESETLDFARASILATAICVAPVIVFLGVTVILGINPLSGTLLSLLVATQLLVEPFAGSLFAFLKVAFGAKSGLVGLLTIYLVVAPVLLVVARVVAPTAVGIWISLLAVRILFALTNALALRRGLQRARGDALAP